MEPIIQNSLKPPTYAVTRADGYVVSDERARLDMDFVHRSLTTVYWALQRSRAQTERSWANCCGFGVYAPSGHLVGFGRLLTDFTFRAHLGDVFIDPACRGLGLGKFLVETILGHPELASVQHWSLTTKDAHSLYARHGFTLGERDGRWMTLDRGLSPS
jgi:GNAT superfamily N-acetyltransferase